MQLRFRHIARNVLSNWFVTVSNMAIGFFLAPFIVHRLGNVAYGVWVLAISSVSYLGLLDLGMRSSILRFVSKSRASEDHAGASDAFSAALWVRVQIAAAMLLLSGVLVYVFPHLFKIPPDLAHQARLAVFIIGVNMTLTMGIGVYGGVLSALNRYDLQSVITLVQLILRVSGVVWVLRTGHGIVAVAICEFIAAMVANILLVIIARRIYPELRVHLRKPRPGLLGELWSYSAYAFLTTVAVQLVYQTDNLVVGTFVSAAAVTWYSIGNSLCRYTDQFIGAMALTFVPAASTYEATGNTEAMRNLYEHGTQLTLAIALPVLITFLTRGANFITLWMGPAYGAKSALVLFLLAFPLMFAYANRVAVSIAFGVGKHKSSAIWAIWEGVSNLVLSVVLVHYMGIYGVALGTMLPNLFFQLVLWPRFLPELTGIRTRDALLRVWLPMFLAVIPFAAVSWVLHYYPAQSLVMFTLQTLFALLFFAATVGWMYRDSVVLHVLPRLRALRPLRAPGGAAGQ